MTLHYRKANLNDLEAIVRLLLQDTLGQKREELSAELHPHYVKAFDTIDRDPNHYLIVVSEGENVIATCHATLLPSLTFTGSMRMQIEGVRVHATARGKGIGQAMIEHAIEWGSQHGATIFQLTTNKVRKEAVQFYEALGFESTHEGMKLYKTV